MLNRELFTRTPDAKNLPNDGVVNINSQDEAIVRYELETFVCEGEYAGGLKRILGTYLQHFNQSKQPAVWVSGFFGSGKSHLVKMLGYLWENRSFSNGDTARTIKQLPESVQELFVELDRKQDIQGRLSVTGTLKDFPSSDIRYSFLQLLLSALELPAQLHLFEFVHWARHEGIYEKLEATLIAQGKTLKRELNNLYVSKALAEAVRLALPGYADTEAQVRENFKANFKAEKTVSREVMLDTIKEKILPLRFGTKIPCLLIVLDEVQQFINQLGGRAIDIQNLAQDLCEQFQGKLLLVSTGQNALSETEQLQPLTDRFSVKVSLTDTDVETVTRKTVLAKKATALVPLTQVLDAASGEIARNLAGSSFAYLTADHEQLTADYPILPSTRKFWRRVLQTVDTAGLEGQLRSQLRIVNEGVNQVAALPVGHVVPADFVFWQKQSQLAQSAVLLNETQNLIERRKSEGANGELESRVLAIVFLLDELARKAGPATKIEANENTIAELLLKDLTINSEELRQQVKAAVQRLTQEQHLMQIGTEYRLQTAIGAEWLKEFRRHETELNNNGNDLIQRQRRERIVKFFRNRAQTFSVQQGVSKQVRNVEVWDRNESPTLDARLYLWVRDGWTDGETQLLHEIRAEGPTVALVYAYVPKQRETDLRRELIRYLAAHDTLEAKGLVNSPEAEQARRSMQTQRSLAEDAAQKIIEAACRDATVYLAGGTKIDGGDVAANMREALTKLADRQFTEFLKGDAVGWDPAMRKALGNAPDALTSAGWTGEAKDHPVGQEILRFLGNSSLSGKIIRDQFTKAPYGWQTEAIDAMLLMLRFTEQISTLEPIPNQQKIPAAVFKRESVALDARDKIALKKLYLAAGIACPNGQELATSDTFLNLLLDRAREAGGTAPLPEPVNLAPLRELQARTGNERLKALVEQKEDLTTQLTDWTKRAETARLRQPQWQLLRSLLALATTDLEAVETLRPQVAALEADRLLLREPDLVGPLLHQVVDALKQELTERKQRYQTEYEQQMTTLQADGYFKKLTPEQKNQILRQNQLIVEFKPKSYDAPGLLGALEHVSLETWLTKKAALQSQFQTAQAEAVKLAAPKSHSFKMPRPTLKSKADLNDYLDELRKELEELLDSGESVVLS